MQGPRKGGKTLFGMKIQRDFVTSNDNSSETREKLLDAAQRVFAEHGFYDATVREICNRARVNLALVNYHFGDKFQLYIEVFRRALNLSKIDILKKAEDPEADPRTLLRKLVTSFVRLLNQNEKSDNLFDILMKQESLRPTPAMEFIVGKYMRPAYKAMCTVIGRILRLPSAHETTRLAANSVIALIKHFGEPQRLLEHLDPKILSGKTPEDVANFIISFALAGPDSHLAGGKSTRSVPRQMRSQAKPKRWQSVLA